MPVSPDTPTPKRPTKRSRRNATPNEPSQIVDRVYQFDDADVHLISSDDILFKVHSYQLMAASSVFREMIAACGQPSSTPPIIIKTINLTDTTIETSQTLRVFLDLLYERGSVKLKGGWPLYRSIELAKKYDCAGMLVNLRATLIATFHEESINPLTLFTAGAHFDDPKLSAIAIEHTSDWRYFEIKEDSLRRPVTRSCVMDISSCSIDTFERIPPTYALALLRAYKKGPLGESKKGTWKLAAGEFLRLMKTHTEL